MKTYIAQLEYQADFYPPLTRDQKTALYQENLFVPLKAQAEASEGELIIKEELSLIGRAIISATERAAKTLRSIGFHIQLKKSR